MSSAALFVASRHRLLILGGIVAVAAFELYVSWQALHPAVSANYRAYYIDQTTTCLDKPTSGRYVLGRTISFMPDDTKGSWALRVCGWDGPAGDGTHSLGTRSLLRFALPGVTGDLVLQLGLTAVEAPDGRAQTVRVSVNGVGLGDTTIPAGETRSVEFPIPASALATRDGRLDIALDYPTAAEMVPNDSDTHFRAVKLTYLQLRRPGDPPSEGAYDDPSARRHQAGP